MKPQPSDDAIRQTEGAVQLMCGHWTVAHPIAIFPSQRKLYECPQGCHGLQKNKGR